MRETGVNRSTLVAATARRCGLDPSVVRDVVDSFLCVVAEVLVSGSRVSLRGFGVLTPRDHGPGVRRHPTRGEVKVPAQPRVTFRPAPALKDRIAGG